MTNPPRRPAQCPDCSYDLAGLPDVVLCPECGVDVVEAHRRGKPKPVIAIVLPLCLGTLGWGWGSVLITAVTLEYGAELFSPDPVTCVVHTATLSNIAGLAAAVLLRREIRWASQIGWEVLKHIAWWQLAPMLFLWGFALL